MSDEKTMWEAIESIGWGTGPEKLKSDVVKSGLLREWDREFARQVLDFVSDRESQLYERLEDWSDQNDKEFGIGDDSFGDLLAHIVGLGQLEFKAVMEDPQKALDRANAKDGTPASYVENFTYVLPYVFDDEEDPYGMDDYKKLSATYYQDRAKEGLNCVESVKASGVVLSEQMEDALNAFQDTFRCVVAAETTTEWVSGFLAYREVPTRAAKHWDAGLEGVVGTRKQLDAFYRSGNSLAIQTRNLMSEIVLFLGDSNGI